MSGRKGGSGLPPEKAGGERCRYDGRIPPPSIHHPLSKALLLLLPVLLIACATQKPPLTLSTVPSAVPYAASLSATLRLGGRTLAAFGGCAVVPGEGARIELRDPFGATQVLLLLTPAEGTLVAPSAGLVYRWNQATRSMPWAPADLLFLLEGGPPPGRGGLTVRPGGSLRAVWRNGLGRCRAELVPSPAGPCPFLRAELRGPGHTLLTLKMTSARGGSFSPAIFQVPQGIELRSADPAQILEEVQP
ncbi:MAG: hypothetical protein ACP5VF_10760 [Acidobacteriota bacterium]